MTTNDIAEPMREAVDGVTHPEEMKGMVEVRLGKMTLRASGRITPAGIVTSTIMAVAVILSATALVRAARDR